MSSFPASTPVLEQVLEKLADISLLIQQLSSLEELFNCAIAHARDLLQSDRVLIYQFSQTGQGDIRAASADITSTSNLAEWIERFDCQEPWLERYRQGQSNILEDIQSPALQPGYLALSIQLQVRASLVVPILFRDQLWGLLIAHQCQQPRQWRPLDLQLLRQIALQIEIAIQQAALQQQQPFQRTEPSPQRSEFQHRSIVEDQTEMIARFSSDSRLLFINEAYCRYFGVNREEMIGSSYKPVIYEPDQDMVAQKLQLLTAENPTITIENRVINAQGEIRWTQWVNRMIIREAGGEVEFQTVGRDITDLKQTEMELRTVRDRLQYLLAYAPAVIFTCEPSGSYEATYISSNVNALLGYTPEQLLHNSRFWLERIHPEDLAQVMQGISQVFTEDYHRHEFRFLHANGTYRWLSKELIVIRDAANQPLELIGYLIDVSDRITAQDALHHSEERFRIVQDFSLDAFTILKSIRDETGSIVDFEWTYVNPRAADILKHPIEELVGKRLLEVLPGNQENSELFRQYIRVVETGIPHDIEIFYNAEGITGWFRNMTIKLEDGVAISFSDITQRKQTEEALRESAEQLQKAVAELKQLNRAKDEFLSTVSHELRTPMTNIKMSIRMLQLNLSHPDLQEREQKIAQYLKILNQECDRETTLINDLLDLQQLDAGKRSITFETINFHQWLVTFIQPFQERTLERQQTLVLELPPETTSSTMSCDLRSLERIVGELLNNACKYTPPGQRIVVSAQLTPEQLQIQVTNFGIEIAAQALPHIFDRFYRVPSADPWRQGGTGLGLALVKKLVEYLNGSLQVESGAGYTSFRLVLEIPHTSQQVD